MPSTEMPMEVGQSNHDSTAPSPTSTPSHQGNMADAPEASFVMSELGSSVGGQEAASQSSEPTSPHPDFVGGIMRITPAEVNVSSLKSTEGSRHMHCKILVFHVSVWQEFFLSELIFCG